MSLMKQAKLRSKTVTLKLTLDEARAVRCLVNRALEFMHGTEALANGGKELAGYAASDKLNLAIVAAGGFSWGYEE